MIVIAKISLVVFLGIGLVCIYFAVKCFKDASKGGDFGQIFSLVLGIVFSGLSALFAWISYLLWVTG